MGASPRAPPSTAGDQGGQDRAAGAGGVPLPKTRPRGTGKDGRELESTILARILRALNAIDGVWAMRLNTGRMRDATGRLVSFEIAPGASDIIGSFQVRAYFGPGSLIDRDV